MPRVRDVLYRFRPSGAPGGASTGGVPIDRAATVAAELEPLFGQLAEVERQCESIQDAARRDAAAVARALLLELAGQARLAGEDTFTYGPMYQRQAGRAASVEQDLPPFTVEALA